MGKLSYVLLLIFSLPNLAFATSASVFSNGTEGPITASAVGSFTAYKHCNDDGDCWYVDTGTVFLYLDSGRISYKSGHGKATATKLIDGGSLAQGSHTLKAVAVDSEGVTSESSSSFVIDNTPVLTPDNPGKIEGGAIDFTGAVTFKERVYGNEGSVFLYLDGGRIAYKYYEGTSITYSYEDMVGKYYDGGALRNGDHTLKIVATASNGASTTEEITFTVDNTPDLQPESPDKVEGGAVDFTGTVDFKERLYGNEGSVFLYLDGGRIAYKYYEGTSITYSYKDMAGKYYDGGALRNGEHTLKVVATASNGASTTEEITFTVDNTPDLQPESPGKIEGGAVDFTGTVDFKERLNGNEGSVFLYLDGGRIAYKYYEGTSITYSYKDMAGKYYDGGALRNGDHTLKIVATASNGASTTKEITFTVDNTPEVQPNSPGIVRGGALDFTGTVNFKERLNGNEGSVFLYLNGGRIAYKYYEGTSIQYSYQKMVGKPYNAGLLPNGEHTLKVVATASNGAQAIEEITFTVDNTPNPSILGAKNYPDKSLDILGKVEYAENITGNEGTLVFYMKDVNATSFVKYGSTKSYEGTQISWKASDFIGDRLQPHWNKKELLVKVIATAANGAKASCVKGIVIPALGGQCEL